MPVQTLSGRKRSVILASGVFLLAVTLPLDAAAGEPHPESATTASSSTVQTTRSDLSYRVPSYAQVSAGSFHTCALRTDLTVACWGWDYYGQATPPGGPFLQVDAGDRHTCGVVQTDGSVACWGLDNYNQATPPSGVFTQVSAAYYHSCGIRTDWTVACWGGDDWGQATPPLLPFYEKVATGYDFSCALAHDETVVCWGGNGSGQATPPAGTFDQVGAGGAHACAVRTDGTLACWGYDAQGQATPPAGAFSQVSGGDVHTCGVRTDGTLACWGDDEYGQATPPEGTFLHVGSGMRHTCGVRTDRTLACWGWNELGQAPRITISPSTFPDASLGIAYSQTLGGTGCTPPYTFAVVGGALPPGLSLGGDGVLSGTPTGVGLYDFTVRAVGAEFFTGERAYTVFVGVATVYVDDDYNPSTPGWGVDRFDSIQDGIDVVAIAGTVNVAEGRYDESVVLDKDATVTVNGDVGIGGSLDVASGTFTAPSGLLTVSGSLTHSGGTFDANGGRVLLDGGGDLAVTASLHSLIVNDGLVGYWKLDEGAGTSAEDSSGYGHEGTLVNDPVRSTDTPPTSSPTCTRCFLTVPTIT